MRKTILLASVLAAMAGPALGHARLIHAAPKVGAKVKGSPAELQLWFSEQLDLTRSSVRVAGPNGPVATGALSVDPDDAHLVRAPLAARLAPGVYRVNWHVTSRDTHETDGDFRFTVTP